MNALAWRLIAIQAVLVLLCIAAYMMLGLSVQWSSNAVVGFLGIGGLFLFWLNHYWWPGTPTERLIAEVAFILVLLLLLVTTVFLAEYAGAALKFPYADPWLAMADARMGVSVSAMASWTAAHPSVANLLALAYATFAPQLLLSLGVLAILHDRGRLWEYTFHFHVCLVMTLIGFVVFPAICAPEYLQFQSTMDESHVIEQIRGFHDGTMKSIAFDDVNGLVSFPSFHVLGVMFVTWAFRGYWRIFFPLTLLNLVVIASTVMSGLHYLVDVLSAIPVFGFSLAIYRWWGKPLVHGRASATSEQPLIFRRPSIFL